jgi:hypothetical protein
VRYIVGSSAVYRGFECGISWVRVRYIVGSSAVDRGFECGRSLVRAPIGSNQGL